MKCMKKALFNRLHVYDLPPERWKSIRTNNSLERALRNLRWPLRSNSLPNLPKHLFCILNSLGKSLLVYKSLYINGIINNQFT